MASPSTDVPLVTADTAAGAVSGYLAVPAGDEPAPAVVVLHEAFGLNADIRAIADRFADEGYLAFAPDLLAGGNRVACLVRVARSMSTGEGAAAEQILAVKDWLSDRTDCTGKLGVAGFCMGGGFAIVLAARGFDVAAPQYGRLPKNLQAAVEGSCPMVASYGGRDQSLRGAATTLTDALANADVTADVKEYPDAGHSFMNHSEAPWWAKPFARGMHAGYVDTAAADAWRRILTMFDSTLRREA